MKRAESGTQKRLNSLRRHYEDQTGVSLRVKFLGCIAADALARVLPELAALDLAAKPLAYQTTVEILVGFDAPLNCT